MLVAWSVRNCILIFVGCGIFSFSFSHEECHLTTLNLLDIILRPKQTMQKKSIFENLWVTSLCQITLVLLVTILLMSDMSENIEMFMFCHS